MRLPSFNYLEPITLTDALNLMEEYHGRAQPLAGGTELLPRMKLGLTHPTYLMSLKEIHELKGIKSNKNELYIGGMTSLREIFLSTLLQQKFLAISEAAGSVAAPPLRNMGTIAGNLCQDTRCFFYNQSYFWRRGLKPCFKAGGNVCYAVPGSKKCFSVYQGDLAPALIAFNAKVRIEKKGSSRIIPIEELFSGKGEKPIVIADDELLTQVIVPIPEGIYGSSYRKFRLRNALDYPLVSAAAFLAIDSEKKVKSVKVVLGAAGPAPVIVKEAEDILKGKKVEESAINEIAEAAYKRAQMVDNLGLPASYRKKMVRVFTKRAIENAFNSIK
ncbi:MAG: hypothetical protein DRP55_02310 [Spirochaetes bacterium]|nr:FAD binding domain-containing protein [Deltaproteobacteria bacterium]RKY02834.1 MAG: hypothetical protein DRP55_02310 [Spirochaetota bacterium]